MTQDPQPPTPKAATPPEQTTPDQPTSEQPTPVQPAEIVEPPPTFGFNDYAEKINGRFAMIGFLILILLELFTHQDLFTWLGLR
ncbi:MAG: chlorophyll a/b-binding protein [Spirulinaceae cyanobacterium]